MQHRDRGGVGGFSLSAVPSVFRGRLAALLSALDEERLGPEQAARVRAERVNAVMSVTVPMLAANLFNGALLLYAFRDAASAFLLAAWMTVLCAAVAPALLSALRRGARRSSGRRRSVRRMVRHSAVLGALWGLPPIVLLPVADESSVLVIAGVTAGMMTGGAFVLAPIFAAAAAWVATMGAGAVAALVVSGSPTHLAAAAYAVVFSCVLVTRAHADARRALESHAAREAVVDHSEMVELLLRDQEALSADAAWSTDKHGNRTRWPDVLGDASALSLVDAMTARATARGVAEIERLHRFVVSREAFHDIVVELRDLAGEDATRWVLLRGTPRWRDGEFMGYHGVANDVTAERAAEERVRFLATHDPVTGIANRSAYAERMGALAAAARPFALVQVDLDRFKAVNDTHGHAAGDALLRGLAGRLSGIAHRAGGWAARIGGDEFAIVLPTRDAARAAALGMQVAGEAVEALRRGAMHEGVELRAGGSAGVAVHPTDADTPERLAARADLALYRAKADGRGRATRYRREMDEEAAERLSMEVDLGAALARGELSLVFQPIVTTCGTRPGGRSEPELTSMETLLRWNHPERGAVSPVDFIPVAEATGAILPIGDWVLREACREAATWVVPAKVSVNASPRQLRSAGFVASVMGALAASGLPPERLEIELTESVLVGEGADGGAIAVLLERLREIGVSVALDDFGTGYSSLSYLRRFRFDRLKIDRAFVNGLDGGAGSGADAAPDAGANAGVPRDVTEGPAIVRAIVDMAHALGLAVTAEGIERPEQADALQALGCHTYQGWLFGRPLDAEAAAMRAGGRLAAWDGTDGTCEGEAAARAAVPPAATTEALDDEPVRLVG